MGLFHRDKQHERPEAPAATAPAGGPAPSGPGVSLAKVTASAPGLVNLYKSAAVSLDKYGLGGHRAAVYLVLDHSGSMHRYYQDGSVQRLAEQVLALAAHLDDDGVVPTVFFGWKAHKAVEIGLDDYQGRIEREHLACGDFGTTNYAAAIEAVTKHYHKSKSKAPAFVVFQTDGEPDSRPAAERAIRSAAKLPIFWQFVGFGNHFEFLKQLDTMEGRAVDNAGFFPVGGNPAGMADQTLLNKLMHEYPRWLEAARAQGIVR
ncbi:VWA domain-containing protein [Streptacidiphilus sp. PB12-B1b]|uniref:VWA domain-containing protein n=1 Tax=Streptacidiphilus sp. PB12-B1b TaxID=2705012 RepID=UPI0015FC88F7|nr:VWA domain-containing protein [Streptacidiphilus sp. PB12-B1b]QMU77868.1 VWA domain-containing protein [Streptacidiphilus sp. PB12-B1b]